MWLAFHFCVSLTILILYRLFLHIKINIVIFETTFILKIKQKQYIITIKNTYQIFTKDLCLMYDNCGRDVRHVTQSSKKYIISNILTTILKMFLIYIIYVHVLCFHHAGYRSLFLVSISGRSGPALVDSWGTCVRHLCIHPHKREWNNSPAST